jgi:glycerol-3-phosphate acyltransferase PlsX
LQLSSFNTITIAIDAMGGDFGPRVTVPACVRALSFMPDVKFILFGDEASVKGQLGAAGNRYPGRVEIVPTLQTIGMDEKPAQVLRNKRDASLFRSIAALADGDVQACVSAGNTGAMLAIGCYLLRTFAGIDRPAICTAVPTRKGRCFLLDIGANVDVHAENLRQFAVMGSVLASCLLEQSEPRVALLNIGEEDIKGNEQVKLAASLMQADPSLNYTGFIEADQLFFDRADVVVCDGFVGNIALKAGEGAARLVSERMQSAFDANALTRLLGWLVRPVLRQWKSQVDPARYNGASFLGLQSTLVKSHGSADIDAFVRAIEQACFEVRAGIPGLINEQLEHSV